MTISKIYVVTWKNDFHLAKLCIASIHYWYPDIPIILIKDELHGDFDCDALYKNWNVAPFPTSVRKFGTGYAKFEPLILPRKETYLMLDADLVLLGPLLDSFRDSKARFIVSPEGDKNPAHIGALAYNLDKLASFDPAFRADEFMFNTGQYVASSGFFKRRDLDPFLEWTEPRSLKHPDCFRYSDQGVTNYLFLKAFQQKRIRLEHKKFYEWGGMKGSDITADDLRKRKGLPKVLHWAGLKPERIQDFYRADILTFYSDYYDWRMNTSRRQQPSP